MSSEINLYRLIFTHVALKQRGPAMGGSLRTEGARAEVTGYILIYIYIYIYIYMGAWLLSCCPTGLWA